MIKNKGIRPNGTINVGNRIGYLSGVIARCPHYFGCEVTKQAEHEIMLLKGYTVCEGITLKGERCKNFAHENSNRCGRHK